MLKNNRENDLSLQLPNTLDNRDHRLFGWKEFLYQYDSFAVVIGKMESEKQEEVTVTDSNATSSTPSLVESLTQQVCVIFIVW